MNQNVNNVPGGSICLCRHFFFFLETGAGPAKGFVRGTGDGDFFLLKAEKF